MYICLISTLYRKITMKHCLREFDIWWIRIALMIHMSKQICYFRLKLLVTSILACLFFLSFSILLSFYWAFPFPNSFIYLPYIFFGRQAHFSQLELPISDYVTDLKSVLDQSIRIIQAMIDICANSGWLSSSITCMRLLQMIMQVSSVPIMMKLWKINLLLFANLSILQICLFNFKGLIICVLGLKQFLIWVFIEQVVVNFIFRG